MFVRCGVLGKGVRQTIMGRTSLGCINDVAISARLLRTTNVLRCRLMRVISIRGNGHFRACAVTKRTNSNVVYLGNTTTHRITINSRIVLVYCTRVAPRRTGRRRPGIIFISTSGRVTQIAGCRGRKGLASSFVNTWVATSFCDGLSCTAMWWVC